MGTRALTVVKNNEGETIVVLYRQSDGYQDCHGKQLKEFLTSKRLVNGIPFGRNDGIANGMGCLAAQLIAKLKDGVGLYYIYPEGVADDWVDFTYTVYPTDKSDNSTLSIKVESYSGEVFDGLVSDYEASDKYVTE